jgi:tetratricopeptide (TPR) repeat protein
VILLRIKGATLRSLLCGLAVISSIANAKAADNAVVFQTCIERAEQISKGVFPADKRDTALSQIALAYARFGSVDQLERTVGEIRDPRRKGDAILNAISYSKIGSQDSKTTLRLLSIAKDVTLTIENVAVRDNFFWRIAYKQALSRDVDEALKTSSLVATQILQEQALYQISSAQSQNDDIDGAIATAELMRPGRWRDDAFAVAAGAIARAGDWERARVIAGKSGSKRDSAIYFMANSGTEKLDFEARLARARQVPDVSLRTITLLQLGDKAARTGNQPAARRSYQEAYQAARSEGGKSYKLPEIGVAQAKAGLIDDALETARAVEENPRAQSLNMNGNSLVWLLGHVAKAQFRAGQKEAARKTVESADHVLSKNEYKNHSATLELVSMAATVGDIEFARRITAQLPPPDIFRFGSGPPGPARSRAWQIIAVQLAKSGDHDAALRMIEDIGDVYTADNALTQIAVEQIWQGHFNDALDTAARISDAWRQVFALTEMAMAHTRPRPEN